MKFAVPTALVAALVVAASLRADITYDGFSSTAGLTINGHATTLSTADGVVLRLTNSQGDRGGSAFSTAKVSTSQFLSVFSFRISNNGGAIFDNNTENGADGLAFVVQNQANNVGGIGAGMGYQSIAPSIAVEFDTWGNSGFADPSQSHIGITINGNPHHGAAGQGPTVNIGNTNAPGTGLPGAELDDGVRYWAWVLYNNGQMNVYLDRNSSTVEPLIPAVPLLSFNTNLTTILGGNLAFAGFTSATGAAWSDHDILYWRYTEAVPEPSTLAAVLFAGAGALAFRKRRKPARTAR